MGRIETLTAENLYLKRNAEVLQSSSKKIEQSVAEINEKLESLTQDSFSRRLEDDLVGACVSQNGSEDMSSIGASVSSDDKHATRNAAKKVSARHSLVSSETIPGSAKRPSMIPRRPGSVKSTSVCKVRPTPTPSGPRQPEAYDKHVDNIERGRENTLHDKLCKGECYCLPGLFSSTLSGRVLILRFCSARPPDRALALLAARQPQGKATSSRPRGSRDAAGGSPKKPREPRGVAWRLVFCLASRALGELLLRRYGGFRRELSQSAGDPSAFSSTADCVVCYL